MPRPQKKTVLGELSFFVHPDQDGDDPRFLSAGQKSVLQFLYRTKFSRY